ncbi:MAG: prepilin-type N-terminal cleavage/methylation domain-containing protein [Sporolactobacillus sp.]
MTRMKKKGFTLVEVLAAVTLFTLVLIAFSSSLIQGQQFVTANGVRQTALQLAKQEMNSVLAYKGDTGSLNLNAVSNAPALFNNNLPSGYTYYAAPLPTVQNNGSFHLYVFLQQQSASSSGAPSTAAPQMVVVRCYYGNEASANYVEIYNSILSS